MEIKYLYSPLKESNMYKLKIKKMLNRTHVGIWKLRVESHTNKSKGVLTYAFHDVCVEKKDISRTK